MKFKQFLQRMLKENKKKKKKKYLEYQMLGRRVICPSEPAYYNLDCRIFGYGNECICNLKYNKKLGIVFGYTI